MEAHLSCRPLSSEDGRGRPVEMDGGKRRNIYIDAASWETALCLGDGNASVGIRKALALAGMASGRVRATRMPENSP